jgi:maltose O-acetyltransferase
MGKVFRVANKKVFGGFDRARTYVLKKCLGACGSNVVLRQPIVIEAPDQVFIGDDVSIASFVHMWGNGTIEIGARTMIGSHVALASASHDPDARRMSETVVLGKITIEPDVWIGAHAVIFPGVTLGSHCVVGAGAVVRSDVAPYAVVAGVPAVVVRIKTGTGPRADALGE